MAPQSPTCSSSSLCLLSFPSFPFPVHPHFLPPPRGPTSPRSRLRTPQPHTDAHACTHTHAHTCTHPPMHTHARAHTPARMRAHTCTCTHAHMCTHAHTHTRAHRTLLFPSSSPDPLLAEESTSDLDTFRHNRCQ
uniref:Uncharacterized protein n=1 Tax=Molossus molossus TaxID=27622 RepID=A0A7J8BKK3_MOLMO|nr:hypothetical protein HJG59_010153 [Molossus molossus]